MNHIRKFLTIFVTVCLVLCCSACGKEEVTDNTAEKQAAIENMANALTIGEVSIDLPLNFFVMQTKENVQKEELPVAYIDLYPRRDDKITFTITGQAQHYESFTASVLDSTLSPLFDEYSGITSYLQGECWGKKTIKAKYKYTDEGKEYFATQYYIFTDDDMYLLNFIAEDESVDAQFESAITTIVVM